MINDLAIVKLESDLIEAYLIIEFVTFASSPNCKLCNFVSEIIAFELRHTSILVIFELLIFNILFFCPPAIIK